MPEKSDLAAVLAQTGPQLKIKRADVMRRYEGGSGEQAVPEQAAPEPRETEKEESNDLEPPLPPVSDLAASNARQVDAQSTTEEETEYTTFQYSDEESVASDAEISLGSADTREEKAEDHNHKSDNKNHSQASENSSDDADIDLALTLPSLRTHFNWVRHQTKRRKFYQSIELNPNADRTGIPLGLLRSVLILIDSDSADSILGGNSPMVEYAWIWAIDPHYIGDSASMTKDGLREEYYGYMRVRLQQLVNDFWVALWRDEIHLKQLWEAAKVSANCAFVSMDPG